MPASRSVRAVLAGALAGLGVPSGAFRYRALPGGLNNRSYLVTADAGRWVVKIRSAALGPMLDIAAEAEVTAAAARAGLAPAVLGHEAAAGVLVTEYRPDTRSWSAKAARAPTNIRRIAGLLRRLHAVRAPARAFEIERVAREYIDAAAGGEGGIAAGSRSYSGSRRRSADAARSLAPRADELARLARRYEASYPATVLCHNDLAAANVLDDGRQLTLVDFEYAVLAAPILDLANLATMNAYSDRERAELLEAYDGRGAIDAGELHWIARMVALLGWFWAAANERTAAEPAVYARIRADLGVQLEAG